MLRKKANKDKGSDSLPSDERDGLDNGRLDNLLAGEHTPRDGVRAFRVGVCPQVALLVDGVVGDSGITLDPADQGREQFGRDKELEVRLMI